MIFVTVGTHEDSFDRLVEAVDRLKGEGKIQEDVFIQTGYSTYEPQHCQFETFIPYQDMMRHMARADMVITHGGTGSIMLVLYHSKIPLVMPRQGIYHEHIDDHQVLFCKTMEEKGKIIAAYEVDELEQTILSYHERVHKLGSRRQGDDTSLSVEGRLKRNANLFAQKISDICNTLI